MRTTIIENNDRTKYKDGNGAQLQRRNSWNRPLKVSHAQAAAACTKVVEDYKGDQQTINKKCAKIRDAYFFQDGKR